MTTAPVARHDTFAGERAAKLLRSWVSAQGAKRLCLRPRRGHDSPRTLVVVAYPGDESIGAAGRLARLRDSHVICAGMPPLPCRNGSSRVQIEREMRWALSMVGMGSEQVDFLGLPNLAEPDGFEELCARLEETLRLVRPSLVLTHSFEGGDPGRDAVALAVSRTVEALRGARPTTVEFPSWGEGSGDASCVQFLDTSDGREVFSVPLDDEERMLKARMLSCYPGAIARAEWIHLDREIFRVSPGRATPAIRLPGEDPMRTAS